MIDQQRLLNTLLELIQIDSPSGQEAAIGAELARRLQGLGLQVVVDQAGNVLGRQPGSGRPLILSAHMDTVPGTGIKPVVKDGVVYSDGTTILGSDDKSGIAVILEVLATLREEGQQPTLEVAFSIGEETGLIGAKAMDVHWFQANEALVLDSGGPLNAIVHAAPSSDKFRAVVHGRAAHAGVRPEEGINAIAIAAQAIARMPLGRIDEETTANIGLIQGGKAVNIVPDWTEMRGEARSHNTSKLDAQIAAMRKAIEDVVAAHEGAGLELDIRRTYEAYKLPPDSSIIRRVTAALAAMGEEPPILYASGGGSDANILNARGIAAIPISTGMQDVHTTHEQVTIAGMVHCAQLVLHTLVTPAKG